MRFPAQMILCLLFPFLLVGCVESRAGSPPGSEDPIEHPHDPVPADPDPEEPEPGNPSEIRIVFLPETGPVRNPERGFHAETNLVHDARFTAADTYSLARSYVRLDAWRTSDLPGHLFDSLEAGLQAAREAGVKIILRFSYNFGPND